MKEFAEQIDTLHQKLDCVPHTIYYAYSNGKLLYEGTDIKQATNTSGIIEQVKNPEYLKAQSDIRDCRTLIVKKWLSKLRSSYSYLNDEIFNACYSRAYDASHSSGYNEVELEFDDLVGFINNIESMWNK